MTKLYSIGLIFINPLSAIALAFLIPDKGSAWLATMVVLSFFTLLIGLVIDGRPLSIIIDSRNCYSLSKFQMLGWTILVLSAWTVFVAARLQLGMAMPAADVGLPGELVALMGISATSLVASPALLSLKTTATSTVDPATLGEGGSANGTLFVRADRSQARFIDIFRGDDVTNYNIPDVSKLQQVVVSLMVMVVYAASIWHRLPVLPVAAKGLDATRGIIASLPPLRENLVWLIGISHGGYLAYKAAPHSASQS